MLPFNVLLTLEGAELIVRQQTWHLGRDAEGVRQLGLAGPELAEGLGDGHRIDAAAQHLVQLGAAGRQTEDVATVHRSLQV